MYRLQRGNQWESGAGHITKVTETELTIEEADGVIRTVPVASLQGWVQDGVPVRHGHVKHGHEKVEEKHPHEKPGHHA